MTGERAAVPWTEEARTPAALAVVGQAMVGEAIAGSAREQAGTSVSAVQREVRQKIPNLCARQTRYQHAQSVSSEPSAVGVDVNWRVQQNPLMHLEATYS